MTSSVRSLGISVKTELPFYVVAVWDWLTDLLYSTFNAVTFWAAETRTPTSLRDTPPPPPPPPGKNERR